MSNNNQVASPDSERVGAINGSFNYSEPDFSVVVDNEDQELYTGRAVQVPQQVPPQLVP